MGRKKKGEFSRDAILQKANEDKDTQIVVKDVSCTSKKKGSASQAKHKKQDDPMTDKAEGEKEALDIIDENEEVFEDDYNVKYEDDILELTRLMSICDVADNPEEFQKQLNLACLKR